MEGITLKHGGDRTCEPIYEDLGSFGAWDRTREERTTIRILPEHLELARSRTRLEARLKAEKDEMNQLNL